MQGPPGKPGIKGERGERGDLGPLVRERETNLIDNNMIYNL